jgi:alpha-ketoglutarate-dependent taurine dioxygenase
MSPEETQDFLQDLTDKIKQPPVCYAHECKQDELLIIDDRASWHKAGFDCDHSQHHRLCRMRAWRPSILSAPNPRSSMFVLAVSAMVRANP